ncbi:response regulator [Pantoea dispersa]|uniref:Response regulator n=2 Tax=Pantoea dispersa TaxID=59814 RepID=A0ABY2ZWJ1_9GAMM|nr:response regulator [Pantoea dispersa]TQC70186.1 response regulator [Pantoea dispersa]
MAQVVVVDDHPIARMAVRYLLEQNGHTVLAESADGREAVTLIQQQQPDIVIIDIDLPSLDGIEVVKSLRDQSFPGKIIVISGKNENVYAVQSLRSGANGFVSKKTDMPEIVSAIQATQSGYGYFPLGGFMQQMEQESTLAEKKMIESLSPQEFQVFHHIIKGLNNMRIAARMGVSNKTVSTYKSRLMDKLHCKTMSDLFAFVHRNQMEAS